MRGSRAAVLAAVQPRVLTAALVSATVAEVSDALALANCSPRQARDGATVAQCPVCGTVDAFEARRGARGRGATVACARECDADAITAKLELSTKAATPPRAASKERPASQPRGAVAEIARRAPVPVPTLGPGTGNGFREPAGTAGTGLFEPISSFMERASTSPPREWLIDGLLPSAGKVMLVAAPNAGKTWLALIALKSAAALGRECFLVEEEGGLRALADRVRALGLHDLPGVNIAHLRGLSLDDAQTVKGIQAALKAAVAPVLELDPLNSVWGGDENDTYAATKLRKTLDALCAANPRALVMVLHHTSKAGERGEGPALYASRGSSVFSGWADCQLNLTHVSTPKGAGQLAFDVVVAKMRDGERGHRVRFRVDLGTGTVTQDEQRDRTQEEIETKVIEALRAAQAGLSKSGAAKAVHARKEAVGRCIDELVARRLVEIDPKGLFRLKESTDAHA